MRSQYNERLKDDIVYQKNGSSIAGFGDGEFEHIFLKKDPGFQKRSEEPSDALRELLLSDDGGLLICLPSLFDALKGRSKESKSFWRDWLLENDNQKNICGLLRENRRGSDLKI